MSSVDSRLVMCVKPGVVNRVQSGQPWVILWDCLDSFHGKLDEGSSTRAERSGDVTAFSGLCVDSTGLHRPGQTIQLKAVRGKELRKRKINKSCTLLGPGAFPAQCAVKSSVGWAWGAHLVVLIVKNAPQSPWFIKGLMLFYYRALF